MTKKGCVLILAATVVALALRLPRLKQRPMHGDEAVHAIKFEDLLERGVYAYDPNEYHGPTLNYLTLIPAWLTGARTLAQTTEFTLRIVPVFFGVCLVLLLLLLMDGLGTAAAVYAGILTAISAAMVLQPVLYSGNAAGMFHFRRDCIRLQVYSEQEYRLGFVDGGIPWTYARHQGNMYYSFWRDVSGCPAHTLDEGWQPQAKLGDGFWHIDRPQSLRL
jgi:hypothetical protein